MAGLPDCVQRKRCCGKRVQGDEEGYSVTPTQHKLGFFLMCFIRLIIRLRLLKMMKETGVFKEYTVESLHLELEKIKEIEMQNDEMIVTEITRKISNVYRRRFAIESSYRMRNIVKPRTSTRDVIFRYFFTIISFLLRNALLYLQKKHFTIAIPGPITIDEEMFRFGRFILFVEEWLRRKIRIQLVVQCLR
ncbi:MAG: hypothetical protein QCH31_11155 [Methanolobus sp.]|nr:hypothetical protein [Methanolobus sp.]